MKVKADIDLTRKGESKCKIFDQFFYLCRKDDDVMSGHDEKEYNPDEIFLLTFQELRGKRSSQQVFPECSCHSWIQMMLLWRLDWWAQ